MGNYNKNCISVNDFQNNCSQQIPYEGYVEGLGYASVIYHYTMAKRKYYGEPESYFANIVREQRLEISQDTISRSQDVDMHIAKKQSNSGKIMTATIAVSGFLIACYRYSHSRRYCDTIHSCRRNHYSCDCLFI